MTYTASVPSHEPISPPITHHECIVGPEPDMEFGEVGKEVGRQWKELSEQDKVQWTDKAAADKERYESECKLYPHR
jgi:hypothetical protein